MKTTPTPPPLTPLQRMVYDTVKEITEAKQGNTDPNFALITEIRNSLHVELMEALRDLCRLGILAYSLDVNRNPMFKIKQEIENGN